MVSRSCKRYLFLKVTKFNPSSGKDENDSKLRPGPRMNTSLTIKGGLLYLYGGILEQGERSYILNDLWSLDIKKMNQWKRINRTDKVDWEGSDKEGKFF